MTREEVATSARAIVFARLGRVEDASVDSTPLGSAGFGLDSIAIAEIILDCERRFGIRLSDLLDGEPITIQRIVRRVLEVSVT